MTTESRIHSALRAVEAHSQTLSVIEAAQNSTMMVTEPVPPQRSTSLPPVLKAPSAEDSSTKEMKDIYRLDV